MVSIINEFLAKDLICPLHHIEYDPTGANIVIKDFKVALEIPEQGTYDSYDPICCLAISDKYLIIARESGMIKQFLVPHVVITKTHKIPVRPHKMSINCNST